MDISFVVLIVAIFIGRFMQFNAFKNLSDDDKVKILSKNIMQLSQLSSFITLAMVVVFYLMMTQYSSEYKMISIIFFGAILLLRIITYVIVRKNMIANDVPEDYIRKYFLSWFVTTTGVVVFVILLVKPYF
jgi:hypothetical protein